MAARRRWDAPAAALELPRVGAESFDAPAAIECRGTSATAADSGAGAGSAYRRQLSPAELRARYSKTIPTNYSRESSQNQANFVHTMSLRLLQMLNNHESSIKKSEFLEHLSTQENLTE